MNDLFMITCQNDKMLYFKDIEDKDRKIACSSWIEVEITHWTLMTS